jgi:hypothetical protein
MSSGPRSFDGVFEAGDGVRTRDPQLGKRVQRRMDRGSPGPWRIGAVPSGCLSDGGACPRRTPGRTSPRRRHRRRRAAARKRGGLASVSPGERQSPRGSHSSCRSLAHNERIRAARDRLRRTHLVLVRRFAIDQLETLKPARIDPRGRRQRVTEDMIEWRLAPGFVPAPSSWLTRALPGAREVARSPTCRRASARPLGLASKAPERCASH